MDDFREKQVDEEGISYAYNYGAGYYSTHFGSTEDGVPLVPYVPDNPLPTPMLKTYGIDIWDTNKFLYCDTNKPAGLVECTATLLEDIDSRIALIKKAMSEWEEGARRAGHDYAKLVYDGYSFKAVYYRPATIDDIIGLKMVASVERALISNAIDTASSNLKAVESFLENFGGDTSDAEDGR